jgi:colicin import membrane protein
MKKLLIIVLLFLFNTSIYSQTIKTKVSQTATKTELKLKKDGTPDQLYKTKVVKSNVVLKKDGTPDQRFKNEVAKSKTTVTKQTAKAKSAEKKVTDKETGKFRGKKLFTGPNGGKYYINSKGNKTYVN